jgi:hypothetical protein
MVLDELRSYMEECSAIEAGCRGELVHCRADAATATARLALQAQQIHVLDQMRQCGACTE